MIILLLIRTCYVFFFYLFWFIQLVVPQSGRRFKSKNCLVRFHKLYNLCRLLKFGSLLQVVEIGGGRAANLRKHAYIADALPFQKQICEESLVGKVF